jgi:putative ABC transport system permease protein
MNFGITVLRAVTVGTAISGQTFYLFTAENLKQFGALKAMGASNWLIARMLMLQAWTVGFIGYGIGLGLTVLFGMMVLKKGQPPFMLPYQLPLFTFAVIMFICTLAALMGIRRVYKVEPAMVFRG